MVPASIDEFLRDPVGRYVAGRCYVVWAHSRSLAGSAYFGRLAPPELSELVRLTSGPETWAGGEGYDVVVDCAAVAAVDALTFAALIQRLQELAQATRKLRRASVVRPSGLAGAIVAGVFHDEILGRYQSAIFADRAEAFAWLGHAEGSAVRTRIDQLMASVIDEPVLLRELRRHLMNDPARASLAMASRTLALSERSLSRRLSELGTTFREEVLRARLRAAEALLLDSDLKLDAVASEVGFRSRGHFGEFFRKMTGETPADFRARRR